MIHRRREGEVVPQGISWMFERNPSYWHIGLYLRLGRHYRIVRYRSHLGWIFS